MATFEIAAVKNSHSFYQKTVNKEVIQRKNIDTEAALQMCSYKKLF